MKDSLRTGSLIAHTTRGYRDPFLDAATEATNKLRDLMEVSVLCVGKGYFFLKRVYITWFTLRGIIAVYVFCRIDAPELMHLD